LNIIICKKLKTSEIYSTKLRIPFFGSQDFKGTREEFEVKDVEKVFDCICIVERYP